MHHCIDIRRSVVLRMVTALVALHTGNAQAPPWIASVGSVLVDTTALTSAIPATSSALPSFDTPSHCVAVVLQPPPAGTFTPFTVTGIALALTSNASVTVTWCSWVLGPECFESDAPQTTELEFVGPAAGAGAYYLARLPFGWTPYYAQLGVAAFWCPAPGTSTTALACAGTPVTTGFGARLVSIDLSLDGASFTRTAAQPCFMVLGAPPSPSPTPSPSPSAPPAWVPGGIIVDSTGQGSAIPQATSAFPPFNVPTSCIGAVIEPLTGAGYAPFVVTGLVVALSSPNASLTVSWCSQFLAGGRW